MSSQKKNAKKKAAKIKRKNNLRAAKAAENLKAAENSTTAKEEKKIAAPPVYVVCEICKGPDTKSCCKNMYIRVGMRKNCFYGVYHDPNKLHTKRVCRDFLQGFNCLKLTKEAWKEKLKHQPIKFLRSEISRKLFIRSRKKTIRNLRALRRCPYRHLYDLANEPDGSPFGKHTPFISALFEALPILPIHNIVINYLHDKHEQHRLLYMLAYPDRHFSPPDCRYELQPTLPPKSYENTDESPDPT